MVEWPSLIDLYVSPPGRWKTQTHHCACCHRAATINHPLFSCANNDTSYATPVMTSCYITAKKTPLSCYLPEVAITPRTEIEMQRLFEVESSTVRYSNIIFQQTYLPHTETQFILCLKCVLLTLLGQFSFDSLQTEGGLSLLSSWRSMLPDIIQSAKKCLK